MVQVLVNFPLLFSGLQSGSQLRLLSICRNLKICMIARIADLGISFSFFLRPLAPREMPARWPFGHPDALAARQTVHLL